MANKDKIFQTKKLSKKLRIFHFKATKNKTKFQDTAKFLGSTCFCNALHRDTCNALYCYKKA